MNNQEQFNPKNIGEEKSCPRCSPCIASKIAIVLLVLMAFVQLWGYWIG